MRSSLVVAVSVLLGACSGGSGGGAAPLAGQAAPASRPGPAPAVAPPIAPAPAPAPAPVGPGRLRTQGRWIVDAQGRVVLLAGLNSSVTAKRAPYHSWQSDADYDALVDAGFDTVRYVLQWRAIEPQPLSYDDVWLDEVEDRLDGLAARGIHVILDMHQDAWGEAVGGNGAPGWATFTDLWPQFQMPQSLPWQAVYAQPRVIAAFESFWSDRTVPQSGLGVQEHYVRMWRHVARRFKDHPAVIGYDLMNEPYYGADILDLVWEALLHSPQILVPSLIGGAQSGSMTQGALDHIRQPAALAALLDALEGPVREFERQRLQPFMERCAQGIRAEDSAGLLFVEPSILVGIGIRSHLEPLTDLQGQRIGGVVYAPHYYDPIAEALAYDGEVGRAREAFERLAATGRRLDVPVVIGEWGFLRESLPGHSELARDIQELTDGALMGQVYWDFHPTLTSQAFWPELTRPRPLRIAGLPQTIAYDPASKALSLVYAEGTATGPTVIAAPPALYPNGIELLSTDPAGSWSWRQVGARVEVTADARQPLHILTLRPR